MITDEFQKLFEKIRSVIGKPDRATSLNLVERLMPIIPCSVCGTYDYIGYSLDNGKLTCEYCMKERTI
jgi:hypothetical protein